MAISKETISPPNQERITVEQIPPSDIGTSNALAAFLFQQTGKESFQDPDGFGTYYPHTFTSLREMTLPQQEGLLVNFFTERVEGFPNGEELGKELAKINNIPWFRPNQEPNPETLQQLAQASLERLKYPSRSSIPLKIIRENWGEAWNAARSKDWGKGCHEARCYAVRQVVWAMDRWAAYGVALFAARGAAQEPAWEAAWEATRTPARDAAWGTTWKRRWISGGDGFEDITWQAQWKAVLEETDGAIGRQEALSIAEKAFRGTTWYAAWEAVLEANHDARWYAAQDAAWIVVKDLMPARGFSEGNPFEPLMEIHELGYWPIGPVINKETGIKEFVVFVPPVVKSYRELVKVLRIFISSPQMVAHLR